MATARVVEAEEALATGIVNRVADPADVDTVLAEVVAAFTAPAAGAVRGCKQLLLTAADNDLDTQRSVERQVQVSRFRDLARQRG